MIGLGLGGLAFLGDQLSGVLGGTLLALTSNGFAWGLAGVLAGHAARSRRAAALAGTVVLIIASLSYYLCVLLISQRWRLGVTVGGGSATGSGLRSLGITAGFWVVASLCAGPLLGLAGQLLRSGGRVQVSFVAAILFGLLSSQGWHYLIFVPGWVRLDEFGLTIFISALAIITLSATATVVMLKRASSPPSWPIVVVAGAVMSGVGLALWHEAETLRSVLGG